jgi:hypothetical protein
MTDVACFAAAVAGVPAAKMTSTLRRTNSAEISVNRSLRPSAQRYSIATVRPSIQPIESRVDEFQGSWLRLQYAIDDHWTGQAHEVDDKISLVSTQASFGGLRWWFLCPRLNRRARKLYLPLGGRHFRSRQAYGLKGTSKNPSRQVRANLTR